MIKIKLLLLIIFIGVFSCNVKKQGESAAMRRFRTTPGLKFERDNEFYTRFRFSNAEGIGLTEGVTRRDPSGVIKVGDLYYVWYTRPPTGIPVVGPAKANDTLRAFPWDLADLWYATSPDGKNWTEQGLAVTRGPKGSFDARSVFTTDVLVANDRYYLFYQAAADLSQTLGMGDSSGYSGYQGDFSGNVIAMSWADSPDGPWTRHPEPILETGPKGAFDYEHVHDPSIIVRGGKYWLYFKGHPGIGPPGQYTTKGPKGWGRDKRWGVPISWGVAVSDKPEGPYVKSKLNPVICGGHEVIVYPYRKGVCALLSQGPERNSLQFAEDGLNFVPKAHGLDVPRAAGVYRVGNFKDTDKMQGQGITWGLCHTSGTINGVRWNYLQRFDCDLSLERGERIREEYEELKKWLEEQ